MKIKFKQWNCELAFAQYENKRTAILLNDVDGQRIAVATVNIPEQKLLQNEVIIKDWSENEGMLEALIKAGVVKDTGKTVDSGWVLASIAELLIPVK